MQKWESPPSWGPILLAAVMGACSASPHAPTSPASGATRSPTPTEMFHSTVTATPSSVASLLQDNGGCNLPCWWGISPGVTTWAAAEELIAPLAFRVEASAFGAPPGTVMYSAQFPPPPEGLDALAQNYYVRASVVALIWSFPGNVPEYTLTNLVSRLGSPTDILVRTIAEPYQGALPAYLVLTYPNLGVAAMYTAEARLEGGLIHACDFRRPILWLWDPTEQIDLSVIAHQFPAGYLPPDELALYRPIKQVTDQSAPEFVSALRASDAEACLETLPANWR